MSDSSTQTLTDDAASAVILKPTLHHYGVMTRNIKALTDWYATVVGFEVVAATKSPIESAYVTNDHVHHRGGFFTLPNMHDESPRPHVGVGHVAFMYDSVDDLLTSWARLKGLGIEPLVMTCHHTHYAFYYQDPERNNVELLADAYEDEAASLAEIKTPEYIANPMGKRVDPARLIEARRNGMPILELRDRVMAGEFEPDSYLSYEVMV